MFLYYNQSMLTLVIQAGGESRRMGQDKGLVPFLGKPLIQRVLGRLESLGDEVLITTNRPDGYRFLNVPLVGDLVPNRGALGGLYTALSAARSPIVAVVACDLPFASREILEAARDLLVEEDWDAVVPVTGSGAEPFHAVYRRETCLPAVKAVLDQGAWRADAWYPQVRLRRLQPEEYRNLDPLQLTFRNVNTPEELRLAEEIARQNP